MGLIAHVRNNKAVLLTAGLIVVLWAGWNFFTSLAFLDGKGEDAGYYRNTTMLYFMASWVPLALLCTHTPRQWVEVISVSAASCGLLHELPKCWLLLHNSLGPTEDTHVTMNLTACATELLVIIATVFILSLGFMFLAKVPRFLWLIAAHRNAIFADLPRLGISVAMLCSSWAIVPFFFPAGQHKGVSSVLLVTMPLPFLLAGFTRRHTALQWLCVTLAASGVCMGAFVLPGVLFPAWENGHYLAHLWPVVYLFTALGVLVSVSLASLARRRPVTDCPADPANPLRL